MADQRVNSIKFTLLHLTFFQDNYDKSYIEHKPKKSSRKKPKPSALTRSTKRGKKKKKPRSSPSSSLSLSQNTILSDVEITIKTEPSLSVDEVSPCLDVDQMMIQSSPGSHHPSEVFLTDAASVSQVEIPVEGQFIIIYIRVYIHNELY